MGLPSPQYPLTDACSTMFNNTLYTYTSKAFQSLPLTKDAEWKMLSMGVAVQGGVCVKSTPKNNISAAALYIVGGTSNSSTYQGIQRYTFANATWESITPTVPVTQNRLWHNAVYLNKSDSILVYAGSQDGRKNPSSQTFTIQASAPYEVTAYEAAAPPAISPLLMQWTESKAVFIGGGDTNKKVMIFSPSTSWIDSNSTLAEPLYNSSIKAVVINGDDGSKNLYTFDMSVSPNGVNRTILVDADGNPVQNAKAMVDQRSVDTGLDERSPQLMERDNLTVADWPTYNGTLAPSSTRSAYTIATDQSGLVVICGGNEDDVLCLFKARDNCWANATSLLGQKATTVQGIGTNPSTTATTAASTTSIATETPTSNSPFPYKILGAVLGAAAGVALILIAILAFFRWRKKRRQHSDVGHQRRASGLSNEKDDYADRGLPQMSSARQFLGHQQQQSHGSFSSMAILMGRYGHKRGDNKGNGSVGSDTSSQFNKKYKTAISKPIPQDEPAIMRSGPGREEKGVSFAGIAASGQATPTTKPRGSTRGGRRGSMRRSSGWNRYWSGGSGALSILGFGNGSKRTTYAGSDRSSDSHYSDQRQPSQITQVSALPMPLKLGDRPELNRVVSGSPTIAYQSNKFPLTREMSGTIERPRSTSSGSSYDDRNDAFSSGVPASVHEQQSWTPFEKSGFGGSRPTQSQYTESVYTNVNLPPANGPPQPPRRQHAPQQSSDMSWLNLGGNARI